jgi:hypothetical protein
MTTPTAYIDTEERFHFTRVFVGIFALLGCLSAFWGFGMFFANVGGGHFSPTDFVGCIVLAIGGILLIAAAIGLNLLRQIAINVGIHHQATVLVGQHKDADGQV